MAGQTSLAIDEFIWRNGDPQNANVKQTRANENIFLLSFFLHEGFNLFIYNDKRNKYMIRDTIGI